MKEIAYSINPQATREEGCLVLDLMEMKREGYSYVLNPISEKRPVAQWRALEQKETDKEILNFFLKEELAFQQRILGKTPYVESLWLNQVHVSSLQVQSAFKLLASTKKLYCKGKQLVVDLFGKGEFYYEGSLLEGGKLEIKGHLRWRDTDIDLRECEAIIPGTPLWFVSGITLKMVGASVSWKRFQELPIVLEGGAKQSFLEELDPEDSDAPKLVVKGGTLEEVMQGATPHPILVLKDRWGACADLWMDYGGGQKVAIHDSQTVKNEKLTIKRQIQAESYWEKDLLETDFIKKNVGTSHFYCPMDRVAKSLTFLLEMGWHIEDWQGRSVIKQTKLSLEFDDCKQDITVKGHLNYANHRADLDKVVGAFNRREHFIQLSSDTVGLIPTNETKQALQNLVEEGELMGSEMRIRKNRMGALDALLDHASSTRSLNELKEQLQNFSRIEEALPSEIFQGNLRFYQQEGVNWLAFLRKYHFHGILADEMGLGKTVQILAFISRLHDPIKKGLHLIVMPTSLLFNWRNEIHRFLPSFTCTIHRGGERAKTVEELKKSDIILTSYTLLRLDLPLFQQVALTTLVLDEAQVIKNDSTLTAQSVRQLTAELKICLTGTPIENRLEELWSHFHFLMPDLLGSKENFETDIQASQSDFRYLEKIKRKIAPFLIRRRKEDVAADLPARIDQVIWIEMAEEQRALYERLLAGFKTGLLKKIEAEGVNKYRLEILEALLRLRQVCCHPLLVSSLFESTTQEIGSAKFETLFRDLETLREEGHKVLVYSQFTSMLKLMVQAASARNWSTCYLDGSTTNREEVVDRFQKDSDPSVFFISLKAGGVGLNLTAADYVYLYDPWWNEAVEEQAINRAHRIGRRDVVIAKRLVIVESIEEKMMKLKASKRTIIDALMNVETISQSFTLEDLYSLFTG